MLANKISEWGARDGGSCLICILTLMMMVMLDGDSPFSIGDSPMENHSSKSIEVDGDKTSGGICGHTLGSLPRL